MWMWEEGRIVLLFLTGIGILLSVVVIVTELLVVFGLVAKGDDD